MAFLPNSVEIARDAIRALNPQLENAFSSVITFLMQSPEAAAVAKGGRAAPSVGTLEYIQRQARAFSKARVPSGPKPPSTVPDEMVSYILHAYFDAPVEELPRIQREHALSMGAENMVGKLLECYLASVLEPAGWIWCSGDVVKAADFIKPLDTSLTSWRLLQVKNRSNSENSSSSAIRNGTPIAKWFRTFSTKPGSNWDAFPDADLENKPSEDGFRSFVRDYLLALRG